MFKITEQKKGSWQGPLKTMFASPKGLVNMAYDNLGLPLDTREPQDWDVILKDRDGTWCLAVVEDEDGVRLLNVDTGSKEKPNIVSNMGRENSLVECFVVALQDYWVKRGKHFPRLHPSWEQEVENYRE